MSKRPPLVFARDHLLLSLLSKLTISIIAILTATTSLVRSIYNATITVRSRSYEYFSRRSHLFSGNIRELYYKSSTTCVGFPNYLSFAQQCYAVNSEEFQTIDGFVGISGYAATNPTMDGRRVLDKNAAQSRERFLKSNKMSGTTHEDTIHKDINKRLHPEALHRDGKKLTIVPQASNPEGYLERQLYLEDSCNVESDIGETGVGVGTCITVYDSGVASSSFEIQIIDNYYYNFTYASTDCSGGSEPVIPVLLETCENVTNREYVKSTLYSYSNISSVYIAPATFVSLYYPIDDSTCSGKPLEYDTLDTNVCYTTDQGTSYYIYCTFSAYIHHLISYEFILCCIFRR